MEDQGNVETVVEFVNWDSSNPSIDLDQEKVNPNKMSLLQFGDVCDFQSNVFEGSAVSNKQKVLLSKNKTTISLDNKEASNFHKGLISHLTSPKSMRGVSVLKDIAKSSPSSPTGLSSGSSRQISCPRQRSHSDSEEKLSAQDKACLEEIERGSQLTLEDQELFEDLGSHKKFDLVDSFTSGIPDEICEKNSSVSKSAASTKVITFPRVKQEPLSDNTSDGDASTNFIDNIDLNQVDPLESALLQSSIPVSLSSKHVNNTQNAANANAIQSVVQQEKMPINSSSLTNTSVEVVQNQPSGQPVNDESQSIAFSLPDCGLPNAAAQTIKQVVVHINGNKQVFDVPQFNGELLTIQPISLMPSSNEGPVNVLLPPQKVGEETQSESQSNVINSQVGEKQPEPVEKSYVCEECGSAYSKPSKLKIHIMSKHTGHRPYKCSYPGCDWAFTAKYKLQRHEECHEKKKNGIKEYQCPIPSCGRMFSTTYNVSSHLKLHDRPLTEECEVCKDKFGTQKALDQHMRSHGESFRNVKCPVDGCNKMFYSRVSMGSHLQSHQRQTSFPCTFEGCGKTFPQKCKLINHMRLHTNEKPYKCTFFNCAWTFATSSHLRRHLKTHTNERNYECERCGKKFLRLEHLRGHMISHTGEKPFVCEIPGCPARFTAKSTMYMHLKRHKHMDLMCVCPIEGCHKVFKSKPYLKKHLDLHYGTEGQPPEETSNDGAVKTDSNSSGLQFINVNLTSDAGNINQILQVSPELAQSLLAASAGSMVETHAVLESEANQPITVPVKEEPETSTASDTLGGSARTDYHRNQVLSSKAKKRRMILKQKAAEAGLDLLSVQDINNTSVAANFDGDDSLTGPVINPHEMMTSRAITIRDPETGAIYVQTQLLQDDPPNLEFEDVGLEDDTSTDFSALFNDPSLAESVSVNGSEFTVSTINLHDLEGVNNT